MRCASPDTSIAQEGLEIELGQLRISVNQVIQAQKEEEPSAPLLATHSAKASSSKETMYWPAAPRDLRSGAPPFEVCRVEPCYTLKPRFLSAEIA